MNKKEFNNDSVMKPILEYGRKQMLDTYRKNIVENIDNDVFVEALIDVIVESNKQTPTNRSIYTSYVNNKLVRMPDIYDSYWD